MRPSDKPDWIGDDTTDIVEPTPAEQDAGWDSTFTGTVKPPRQWFNWFQNRLVQWIGWLSGQSGEYIVIDSTAGNEREKDYDTLADYIADSPSAGDKVLVKNSQVLTPQMIIPDDITLRILDGVNFTRSTLDAASVIKFGSNIIVEGVLNLQLFHTGTTAVAIEIDGSDNYGKINVVNVATGIVTNAFIINAGKEGNYIHGISKEAGGGSITNPLTDNSSNNSNYVIVRDNTTNKIVRSAGVRTFNQTVRWNKGADVASAAALPIIDDGNYNDVTGTTTITSIDSSGKVGTFRKFQFDAILTLTYHATNLILPGGVNIVTAPGDEAEFMEYATGDWRCTNYQKASGQAISGKGKILQIVQTVDTTNRSTSSTSYVTTNVTASITPSNAANKIFVMASGVAGRQGIVSFTLFRDAVDLTPSGVNGLYELSSPNSDLSGTVDIKYLDSPASVSSITYSLRFKVNAGTGYLGRVAIDTRIDVSTTLTLMEVEG